MSYDISYNSVSLLLNGDGASITDRSPTPKTVTAVGNAQISTTQSKFGGSSIKLDGTGDYLSSPNDTAFEFGTGDFTVEGFVYIEANSTADVSSNRPAAIATYGTTSGSNTSYWWFNYLGNTTTTGTGLEFALYVHPSAYVVSATASVSQSAWHHVAVSRVSGSTKLFLDGVELTLNTNTLTTQSVGGLAGQPLTVGATLATGYTQQLNGYIDEFRITKGVGRYTTTFTPPTEAFAAQASETASAALVAPKPTLEFFGGDNANLIAPSPMFYAGDMGYMTAELTAPIGTLTANGGGSAAFTAPSPTLSVTARGTYGENAVIATAPSPTLMAYAGDNARLTAPSPTLTSTGTGTGIIVAALTAPSPTLASTGTSTGILSAELTAPRPNLVGYGGAVCSITGPMGTLTATGTTGSIASVQVTVPMAQLTATVTRQGSLSALLTAPSPRMGTTLQAYLVAPGATLTAIGSATITATYEAYALNLNHAPRPQRGVQGENDPPVDELTRYTNFPFTQVVRYKNSYYGVAAGALYLLEGTTDDATPVPYAVETTKTDFDMTERKTVVSAYLGGRLGPAQTVSLVVGESATKVYSHTTPRGALAQNHRQRFGLGIRDRYYALRVEGSSTFEVDTIDFEVNKLTRRI